MMTQTRMVQRAIIAAKTGMSKKTWTRITCSFEDPNSDDEEDETAELLRELEKIKRERAEQKEKEVSAEKEPKRLRYCC